MKHFFGEAISGGVALGTIRLDQKKEASPRREAIDDVASECARFENARREAIRQIAELIEQTEREVDAEHAAIFRGQAMLLADATYTEFVRGRIEGGHVDAASAAIEAGEHFAQQFLAMPDATFRARAADMRDISGRVAAVLAASQRDATVSFPAIVAADEFLPGAIMRLDRKRVLGLVARRGSSRSHAAMLARALKIPMLTGMPIDPSWDGREAIVDGDAGALYLEPDEETRADFVSRRMAEHEIPQTHSASAHAEAQGSRDREDMASVTRDGKTIHLYANIARAAEVKAVLANGGEGIGLFRSEFLFVGRDEAPGEEEQFQVYRSIAEAMDGRRVVIRTLDVGADKQADYIGIGQETNPALGFRGIRICFVREDLFRTQLRAIFRARAYGAVSILYPMITSVEEVRRVRAMADDVRAELAGEGISIGEVEQGIMIETPAAALISDLLAPEVDFFSIGTNDLTQYALAMDRQDDRMDALFDPHHEAVLRLIELTARNGRANGMRVGICGELGADVTLTERFLQMGIDELSVAPDRILPIRRQIQESRAQR